MFASQRLAQSAHDKELLEAQARIKAQRALATAQAQAAQRALSVAREKVRALACRGNYCFMLAPYTHTSPRA